MMNFAHGGNGWGGGGSFGHMNGFGHMGGFGGSIFAWILMLLFAALIITGIVYLIKKMKNNSDSGRKNNSYSQIDYKRVDDRQDTAHEIARERYAKGEIDQEELKEILRNLKK